MTNIDTRKTRTPNRSTKKKNHEKVQSTRLQIFSVILLLFTAIILSRYTSIMTRDEKPMPDLSSASLERGPILDRNGRVFAITTKLDSVTAWIPSIINLNESVELLEEILKIKKSILLSKLERGTDFVFIQRKITPTQSAKINSLKNTGKLVGFSLQPEHGRSYPQQNLASHVLGFVGIDNTGLEGLENTLDDYLSPNETSNNSNHIYGAQVFLTLDVNIQHEMESIAEKASLIHQTDTAFVLCTSAKTGEVLAYASYPTFDPNNYGAFSSEKWRNQIASTAYEPGSVFKVFSLAAFLQAGVINTSMRFNSPGYYQRTLSDGFRIKIDDLGTYGLVDLNQIIKYSSNAGAAYASDRIDATTFYNYLTKFGFGNITGLPVLGESYGILREVNNWSARSKPTIAIGQEISVTALQIVQAASALANNGILLQPQIIKKILSADGKVIKEFRKQEIDQVLSREVSQNILKAMENTTSHGGTAHRAKLEGYRISAKTGTAQVINPLTKSYSENQVTASILGIFPTEDPEFIVYIVLHNPKGEERYGGVIAAPLLREAAEFLSSYYIIPDNETEPVYRSTRINIPTSPKILLEELIPDLRGLPKRRLLPLFGNSGYRLEIHGSGYVEQQFPPPGKQFRPGSTIKVWLN